MKARRVLNTRWRNRKAAETTQRRNVLGTQKDSNSRDKRNRIYKQHVLNVKFSISLLQLFESIEVGVFSVTNGHFQTEVAGDYELQSLQRMVSFPGQHIMLCLYTIDLLPVQFPSSHAGNGLPLILNVRHSAYRPCVQRLVRARKRKRPKALEIRMSESLLFAYSSSDLILCCHTLGGLHFAHACSAMSSSSNAMSA